MVALFRRTPLSLERSAGVAGARPEYGSADQMSAHRISDRPDPQIDHGRGDPAISAGLLHRIAVLILAAPRRILLVAAFAMIGAGWFGLPVANHLADGGFQDPNSESSHAADVLAGTFQQSEQQLLITVAGPQGAASEPVRNVATGIIAELRSSPLVLSISSPWSESTSAAAALVSEDGKTGLIVANLGGDEESAQKYAEQLTDVLTHERDGVVVRAGGAAMVDAEMNMQLQHDLLRMEAIALPITFIVLVWVFGGLLASAVPIGVGMLAILGSMAVLRLLTYVTDISFLALNITSALGLALAVDYTLLIISRYREEIASGLDPDAALIGPALLSVSRAANWGDLSDGESAYGLVVAGLGVAERESAVDLQ